LQEESRFEVRELTLLKSSKINIGFTTIFIADRLLVLLEIHLTRTVRDER